MERIASAPRKAGGKSPPRGHWPKSSERINGFRPSEGPPSSSQAAFAPEEDPPKLTITPLRPQDGDDGFEQWFHDISDLFWFGLVVSHDFPAINRHSTAAGGWIQKDLKWMRMRGGMG